jgi:hypothetical protein
MKFARFWGFAAARNGRKPINASVPGWEWLNLFLNALEFGVLWQVLNVQL